MTSRDGTYHRVIDQAAADVVRVLLEAGEDVEAGAVAARQVLAWVAEHHGTDAVADVALTLGGDVEELITLRARDEATAPLEVWDRWSHDEPQPGG